MVTSHPSSPPPHPPHPLEPALPHVVIEEALDLGIASQGVALSATRAGAEILKVVDLYLNRSGRTALVDCVAVEEGRSQSFFVQLSQKDRQITVRLLPATDPEKTTGVKRLMAHIARQLLAASGGGRFGKTNLQDFLA
ncbi:MAG: hypothetical protein IPO09_19140 [Anaeromyxobacter sp.]|nr:hypothetical protein [Anaeromyxobacter sp.]